MIPDDLKELLQTTKALPPLPTDAPEVFARIRRLPIAKWNEAQVRAEVIDPIIRLLGYDVESDFKAERERTLEVVGAHKAVDYSMTAFNSDFWLIEAKRPNGAPAFDRDAVYQALRYAAHPDVNAALMVLCDGEKLEVFDREESLKGPILSLTRNDLEARFDELRQLLSPWQQFLFERRRVLRLIDRCFDHESHLGRVEEMVTAVKRRLRGKRQAIADNMRARSTFAQDWRVMANEYAAAPAAELVEVAYWFNHCAEHQRIIRDTLVGHAQKRLVDVVYRVFPERPRAANYTFWAHALDLAIALDEAGVKLPAMPEAFGASSSAERLAETLIVKTLTGLIDDEPRRIIALHAAAVRRKAKLDMLVDSQTRSRGEMLHLEERVAGPEHSFSQEVSSPTRHLLLELEGIEIAANARFVDEHKDLNGRLLGASAIQSVRDVWNSEINVLGSIADYRGLLAERGGGEIMPTEAIGVDYDQMAHSALCVIDSYPKWKAWTLAHHANLVEQAAVMGSWQARKWINWPEERREIPNRGWFEARFGAGDANLFWSLRAAYGHKLP